MNAFLTVLPMTFVMIAGPQIIASVFLATSTEWARNSVAYIVGAALSITVFVTIAYLVVRSVKSSPSSASSGGEGQALDAVLILLLVLLAVIVYGKRGETEPPKWMGEVQEGHPQIL